MVGLNKIMLHIATGLGHVRIIGHDEKSMLIIHQLLHSRIMARML